MRSKLHAFQVYSIGLVHISVCSSLSLEETLEMANIEHPTGLNHGWIFSPDAKFASGHDNPCPCNYEPETHKHYLLNC
jgi:hypothetical protein